MTTHLINPFSRNAEKESVVNLEVSEMRVELDRLRERVDALEAVTTIGHDYVEDHGGYAITDAATDADYLQPDLSAALGVLSRLGLKNNAAEENHGKYLRWARNMTSTSQSSGNAGQCDIPVRRQVSAWFLHNAEKVEANKYSYQSLADELRGIASVSPVEVNWREQKSEQLAFAWLDQAWRYVSAKNGLPF